MQINRRQALAATALPLLGSATTVHTATAVADKPTAASRALHALFDRYWQESARRSPEWATMRGDHRFGDRWSDLSAAGIAERDAMNARWLAEAKAIPADGLSLTDRRSRELFIFGRESDVREAALEGWRTMRIGSLRGTQTSLSNLLRSVPVDNEQQVEQLLARLDRYPTRLAQEIDSMARGIALGWVPARPVLERALAQLDGQLRADLRQGPFFEPFRKLGPGIAQARREQLRAHGEAVLTSRVLPALQQLRSFIVERYLPAAPAAGGLLRYRGGDAVYAERVRDQTTTALTPAQIHQMGRDELARLRGEINKVMAELKFSGSFQQFVAHLRQPEHFYPNAEALFDAYRIAAKRLDPEMPRLFAELPRAPYGIRPMPAHLGAGAADNYNRPADDGSGPGWYNANVLAFQRRPRWAVATLVAHETVPGHHLQGARALELGDLPAFRRNAFHTAFGEGWALYAETLCDEIGLFETPQERYGHLQAQAFRASRLVVDTGLHALGWSRQQAIDSMIEDVGESRVYIESEVDRYLSNPGQALAYMVGKQHILAQRDKARSRLGPQFDLRRFNNAVIDQGALPLEVLTTQIDEWVAAMG
ncbi:DUF885 domain-containing protein [Piscinibacter sakaiensis]|uniref:DUF885 domain-containing protein n=1 Tax=Piscinibacter sakaiensis TaxID=1547922 RepID=UPI003AAAEF92